MDMKAYYKTSSGKVVELKQQNELNLWSENIIELIIPDGCEYIYCENNRLKELNIPDGCKIINCRSNQLKELIILNSCEYVSCWNNQLKELVIPNGCKRVKADMKSITELNKVEELNLWI